MAAAKARQVQDSLPDLSLQKNACFGKNTDNCCNGMKDNLWRSIRGVWLGTGQTTRN